MMEQILLVYDLPKETVSAITMLEQAAEGISLNVNADKTDYMF